MLPFFLLAIGFMRLSAIQFPIDEFYGLLPGSDAGIRRNITHNHLCKAGIDERSCCHCDEYCLHFRDCCIDRLWNETWRELGQYLEHFQKRASESKITKCLPVVKDLATEDRSEEILMVSSCQLGFRSAKSTRLCEADAAIHMPVFGSDMYVYRNPDCAICNEVESFSLLNVTAQCRQRLSESDEQFPQFRQCTYSARMHHQFSQFIRRCRSNDPPVRACPEFERSNVEIRNSFVGVALGGRGVSYLNLYFLECNEGFAFNFTVPACEKIIPEVSPVRFSMLISFGKEVRLVAKDGSRDIGIKVPKCPVGEVYDVGRGICRHFVCGPGYMKTNTMCVKVNRASNHSSSSKGADVLTQEELLTYCLLQQDASMAVETRFSGDLGITTSVFEFMRDFIDKDVSVINPPFAVIVKNSPQNETYSLTAKLKSFLSSILEYPEVLAQILNVYLTSVIPKVTHLHGADLRHVFPGRRTCARFVVRNLTEAHLYENCSLQVGNKSYSADKFVIHSKYELRLGAIRTSYFVTCDLFYAEKSCAMRLHTNYTQHKNLSITLWDSGAEKIFTFEHYVPMDEGIGVCVPTQSEPNRLKLWMDTLSNIEFNLTVCCALISALCYLVTIVTYCCFRDLRTVPGHNIAALCLALLLSDILVLSTVAVHTVPHACRIVGILLHWLLLAAVAWSTVVSFEIWLTLSFKRSRRHISSNKRFLCYLLYANLMPTLVVAVAGAFGAGTKLALGYGTGSVCWITNLTGRIIFYIAPFAASWVLNFAVLTSTMIRLYRQQKRATKLLKKVTSHEIKLARTAAKLMVLLGVVEIVGFIQLPGSSRSIQIVNATFAIAYTVLRGLRGFSIALMYVFCDRKARSIIHTSKLRAILSSSRSLATSSRSISTRKEDVVTVEVYKNTQFDEVAV